jgi:hypothetical protein
MKNTLFQSLLCVLFVLPWSLLFMIPALGFALWFAGIGH